MSTKRSNPKTKSKNRILDMLRQLDLPSNVKAKLRHLYDRSRNTATAIIQFLYSKRNFCAYVLLGVCLFYLLSTVPLVGPILASLSLSASLILGVFRQFEADMRRTFSVPA